MSAPETSTLASRVARPYPGAVALAAWLSLVVLDAVCLVIYGTRMLFFEDWAYVAPITGHETLVPDFLFWPINEHILPLPKLVLVGLLTAAGGDFRAGAWFNLIALAAVSLLLMRTVASLRGGRVSIVDAGIPLLVLGFGNWLNVFWGVQVSFVLTFGLTCMLLVTAVAPQAPVLSTTRGIALVCLPLCGAAGVAIVLPICLWTACAAVASRRVAGRAERRGVSGQLWCALAALVASVPTFWITWYIRTVYAPNAQRPDLTSVLQTSLDTLTFGFGRGVNPRWTFVPVLLVVVVGVAVALTIEAVLRRSGTERRRAADLLVFQASTLGLVALVGWGRASVVATERAWPAHYTVLGLPALLAASMAWVLYAPAPAWRAAQGAILAVALAAFPMNMRDATMSLDLRRQTARLFEAHVDQGMTSLDLARRHRAVLVPWISDAELAAMIDMLRDNGVGPFARAGAR